MFSAKDLENYLLKRGCDVDVVRMSDEKFHILVQSKDAAKLDTIISKIPEAPQYTIQIRRSRPKPLWRFWKWG